jgi:hypothetical protein
MTFVNVVTGGEAALRGYPAWMIRLRAHRDAAKRLRG